MKLKIHADRQYLPKDVPHYVMLYPFWGSETESIPANQGIYDRYMVIGQQLFELTSLQDAQIAVFPTGWEHLMRHPQGNELCTQLARKAADVGKPLVLFLHNDTSTPVDIPNTVVFRTSGNRSTANKGEHALPGWSVDFVEKYCGGNLALRTKGKRPVVGFCGDVSSGRSRIAKIGRVVGTDPRLWRFARKLGIELIKHPGSRLRLHSLWALSRHSGIEANFIVRYGFWNGTVYRDRILDANSTLQVRQEYTDNMIGSDYILCARGKGNYSYRFYETLSCGRIPILINTDIVLPFEKWIDWRQYCVWVDASDLPNIAERVLEFHERLSPRQFQELQHECHQLWVNWLSPEGFFSNLYRYFV